MPSVRGNAASLPQRPQNVFGGKVRRRLDARAASSSEETQQAAGIRAHISPEAREQRGASGVGSSKFICKRVQGPAKALRSTGHSFLWGWWSKMGKREATNGIQTKGRIPFSRTNGEEREAGVMTGNQ